MRCIFAWGLLAWGMTMASMAMAQPLLYQEGQQYQRVSDNILESPAIRDFQKDAHGKIQVIEFFSYGCNWCYKLDPYIEAWKKNLPGDVLFQRIPVEFHPSWHTLSKAHYAAVDLGVIGKLHGALFDAIQNSQIVDSSPPILREFFIQQGVKGEDFDKTFDSFDVDRQQKWANAMSQAYRITAVPAVLVQGKNAIYLSTVRMAGSEDNLLKVVDFLIQQERIGAATPKSSQNTQ